MTSNTEEINLEERKAHDAARAAIAALKKNPYALVYVDGISRIQMNKAFLKIAGKGLYSCSDDGGRVLVTVRRQFALKK